jgi:hypothetical protein
VTVPDCVLSSPGFDGAMNVCGVSCSLYIIGSFSHVIRVSFSGGVREIGDDAS